MSNVRVRTAPSPTGMPHIGNTWAALMNFLFAKKNDGKFILRLEDTDRARLVEGSEQKIFEILHWLGLEYNEGPDIGGPFVPYKQSERLEFYKKYAADLIEKGLAYQDEGAIRFKVQKEGKTSWVDLVGNRTIEFENSTQEDFVIIKSDGYPTYHFANVIDDHLMEISHVIRGNEWISSAPKHIMLYQALGWQLPYFAHMPVLLGPDRSKLSKRHGAKSALDYRDDGYLKEALLNFIALLGWSPPSGKEILSLEEMAQEFDFKDINLASPIFNSQKLDWMNGEYIRAMADQDLVERLHDFLIDHPAKSRLTELVPLVKERIKKLSDFIPLTAWMFEEIEYDKMFFDKTKVDDQIRVLQKILEKLEQMDQPWKKEIFEQTFQSLAKELNLNNTQMFQLIRVAVSGQLISPPIFESLQILGEDKTIERVKAAIEFLKSN